MICYIRIQHTNPKQDDLLFKNSEAIFDHQWGSRIYSEMITVQDGKKVMDTPEGLQIVRKEFRFLIKFPTENKDIHGRSLNFWMLLKGIRNRETIEDELIHIVHRTLYKAQFSINPEYLHRVAIYLSKELFPFKSLYKRLRATDTIASLWPEFNTK